VLEGVVAVLMQNQAQQLVSLPEALAMQTYPPLLRLGQLLIAGLNTAPPIPRQQQPLQMTHLKVL
jgi:hypothetical protein